MISDLLTNIKEFQKSQNSDSFNILITKVEELSTKGVDLGNFPKQIMHYADEHFASDPTFFASISKLASELISQSKRYPHPLLLYKTVLWNQGRQDTVTTNNQETITTKENIQSNVSARKYEEAIHIQEPVSSNVSI
jgi:hypothetical protein